MKRHTFLQTLGAVLLGCTVSTAFAQNPAAGYPSKPIRIIVGYAPGGGNDILARLVGQKMGETFGQQVIIENRASAGAVIGTDAVAKAAPDGYTLTMGASGPIVFNPSLYAKLPYDAIRDLAPVSMVGSLLLILVDSGPAAGGIKGGLLRGLAVTSARRMPLLPDIPTMAEQGVDLQITLWSGLLAPAGTPPAIIQKLQTEVARIVKLPDVRERMLQLGIEPEGSTPEEFARIIATEIPLWMSVAKANNIQPE